MMSLLALTGLVAYEVGGLAIDATAAEANSESEDYTEDYVPRDDGTFEDGLMAYIQGLDDTGTAHDAHEYQPPVQTEPDQITLDRGDSIEAFDPSRDVLDLEYACALGLPDVTVIDFADGTGASIALNGVVVADVTGAQGLDPLMVLLTAT